MAEAVIDSAIDEAFLCCPLCCRTLHVPKILPCLHIFCRKCLRNHAEKTKVVVAAVTNEAPPGVRGGIGDSQDSGYSGSGDANLKAASKHPTDEYLSPCATAESGYSLSHSVHDSSISDDHDDSYYEIPMNYGNTAVPAAVPEDPAKALDQTVPPVKPGNKLIREDTIYENDYDAGLDNYVTAGSLTPEIKKKISYGAKSVTIPSVKPPKIKEKNPSVSSLDMVIPADNLMRKPSDAQYITPDVNRPGLDATDGPEYINVNDAKVKEAFPPAEESGPQYINADQMRNSKATYKHWTIRSSHLYEDMAEGQTLEEPASDSIYDVPGKPVNIHHKTLDGYLTLDSQNPMSLPKMPAPVPQPRVTATSVVAAAAVSTAAAAAGAAAPPLMKVRQKKSESCNGQVEEKGLKPKKHGKRSKKELPNSKKIPKCPVPTPHQAPALENTVPIYDMAADVVSPYDPPQSHFLCPVCEALTVLPVGGVEEFKTCSLVKTMQDMFISQKKEKKVCGNCDSKPAKFKCLECKKYLCGGCKDAHGWRKSSQKHKVMALTDTLHSHRNSAERPDKKHRDTSSQPAPCHLHRRRQATHLCATCDRIICGDCKTADHQSHNCAHIDTCAKRDRDFLQTMARNAETIRSGMEVTQEQLKVYTKTSLGDKKSVLDKLAQQKLEILKTVEQAFNELSKQVEEEYAIEKRKVDDVKKELLGKQKQLEQGLMLSDNLLKYAKDGDMVAMTNTLYDALRKMKKDSTPGLQSQLHVELEPVKYTADDVKTLFGHLVATQKPHTEVSTTPAQDSLLEPIPPPKLSRTFKTRTFKDTKGCKPTGLTILPNQNILVVDDINKKVKQFDQQGHLLWECCPEGPHTLIDPWDITCTDDDNLAITDRGSKSVKIFTKNGDFVREFGQANLQSAWGIARNSKGDLIVTDAYQKSVFVYDTDGKVLFSIPNKMHADPNLFKYPEYVTVNHNDDIIVSDFDKHCILVFDSVGRLLFSFGAKGIGVDHFNVPCGVCVDPEGNILVADYTNQRVVKLSQNGDFLCHLATRKDSLVLPQALAFTEDCHLIVLDRAEVKVFRFTDNEVRPRPSGSRLSPLVSDMVPFDLTPPQEETVYDVPPPILSPMSPPPVMNPSGTDRQNSAVETTV